jgi:spore photoproduct lyase
VVVRRYEHRTPGTSERIKAAAKVAQAGFPIGFIIAPIFVFPGWQSEYEALLKELAGVLSPEQRGLATFECITHRFTQRAKNQIMDVFPNSILPLTESDRVFKYGQFGYGKYVYSKELMTTVKLEISSLLDHYFPDARVEYIV